MLLLGHIWVFSCLCQMYQFSEPLGCVCAHVCARICVCARERKRAMKSYITGLFLYQTKQSMTPLPLSYLCLSTWTVLSSWSQTIVWMLVTVFVSTKRTLSVFPFSVTFRRESVKKLGTCVNICEDFSWRQICYFFVQYCSWWLWYPCRSPIFDGEGLSTEGSCVLKTTNVPWYMVVYHIVIVLYM